MCSMCDSIRRLVAALSRALKPLTAKEPTGRYLDVTRYVDVPHIRQ